MVFNWLFGKKDKQAEADKSVEDVQQTEMMEIETVAQNTNLEEDTEQTTVNNSSLPEASNEENALETVATISLPQPAEKPQNTDKISYFSCLKSGLTKTRNGFANIFLGKKTLDQSLIDELEMRLLTADVGIEVTEQIIKNVTTQISRKQLTDVEAVKNAVAKHMIELLIPYEQPLDIATHKPYVILMVGINGAGKTTTIGKLANKFQQEGKKVMLAAGDTFRAAAVEQLQTWGERNHVPVIAQATGADAASVAYDALQSAKARGVDVLIIDTAGRLHTQDHLMEELKKVKRVLQKLDSEVPHQTLLVIDAGNGQNALRQAIHFNEAMSLDGIIVTKLDGTAKGGILFATTNTLGLPVRFIGVGEQADDLRPFNANDFVNALLYND